MTGAYRIEDCMRLAEDYRALRAGMQGVGDLIPGHTNSAGQADTVNQVPLGQTAEGQMLYIDLPSVKEYERTHASDPVLFPAGRRVANLEQLLQRCEQLASEGNVREYNRTRLALYDRLELVSGRTARARDIQSIRTHLNDLDNVLSSMGVYWEITGDSDRQNRMNELRISAEHGDIEPEEYQRRVQAIQQERLDAIRTSALWRSPERAALLTRRDALLSRLSAMESGEEQLFTRRPGETQSTADLYAALMVDVDRERRISLGATRINDEIRLNGDYIRNVRAARSIVGFGTVTGGNEIVDRTLSHLNQCSTLLAQAKAALVAGNGNEAIEIYRHAMRERGEAMNEYSAENAQNLSAVAGAHRVRHDQIGGVEMDTRFGMGRLLLMQQMNRQFEAYVNMHVDVFRTLVGGSLPRNEADLRTQQQNMERRLNGVMIIENSILSVPVHSGYQFVGAFRHPQRYVMGAVLAMEGDLQRGDIRHAELNLRSARDELNGIQLQMASNQQLTQYVLITTAIAAMFIPTVGIYISTGIFLGMWADQAYTEYQRDGRISHGWILV
jgi:hypothetical protein